MNPLLIFYILFLTIFIWILLSWAFPTIGKILKVIKTGIKGIMEEDDDE